MAGAAQRRGDVGQDRVVRQRVGRGVGDRPTLTRSENDDDRPEGGRRAVLDRVWRVS
jgi:hypothetical protein